MITFASLFLGLWYGVLHVECVAAQDVASVQLLLDGRAVATLSAPPWEADLDIGIELAPHELGAVARDAHGKQTGRARQWINRPRAEAEASFLLEPGHGGTGRIAHLAWQSAAHDEPVSVKVSCDGKPLAAPNPKRIEIPPYVPERLHFLRAELDFPENVSAVADVTFGGARNEETLTDLTAVPVVLREGAKMPALPGLASSLLAGGAPRTVIAVEEGPAEALFVVTDTAALRLSEIQAVGRARLLRMGATLRRDQRIRLVRPIPLARENAAERWNSFAVSQALSSSSRNAVLGIVARAFSRHVPGASQMIADAVGLAALAATARDRRRAVVLVVGAEAADDSPLAADNVRAFLGRLGVPFFVWSVSAETTPVSRAWGPARDVSTVDLFDDAVRFLRDYLDRQRIVWLKGTLDARDVAFAPGTTCCRTIVE